MKKIVFNDSGLDENDIEIKKKKVRGIIIDSDNKVILCNYCDIYMFPGGKVESGETSIQGLIRELNEELGIIFEEYEFKPLLSIVNIVKDYPIRNSNNVANRMCQTELFVVKSDKKINKSKIRLTESEKKQNFRIECVPINRVLEVVENSNSKNNRNKYFAREIMLGLKEIINNYYIDKNDGLIDMHIHSNASDGEFSANEIVDMAINNGGKVISITDHDTIMGYKNLIYDTKKIKVIPGVELSSFSEVGRMHILGYGFDLENKFLNEELIKIHNDCINNFLMFVDFLSKNYSITFSCDDIDKLINLDKNLGRPDLAKLLIRMNIVNSVDEAFNKFLIDANDKLRNYLVKPSYIECINMIREANGIPVLAHPHSLLLDDNSLYLKILEMKKYGLGGIESYHSNTNKNLSNKLVNIAVNENLYLTGGSDYHGSISKSDINLFTGRNNNIKIKRLNIVNKLNGYYNDISGN